VKINPEVIQTLVTFLTGGGLITLLVAAVRSYRTVRTGALSSTRAVVKDLVEARNEAESRQDAADRRAVYWQDVAMQYRQQLLESRIMPEPRILNPPPINQQLPRRKRPSREQLEFPDDSIVSVVATLPTSSPQE
jgi:tRNA(Met) C34 N-acetyltransferase TmcA